MSPRRDVGVVLCVCRRAWVGAGVPDSGSFGPDHGYASQGFVHTDNNHWLTMYTSHVGSGEFTDFGVNASPRSWQRVVILTNSF